MPSPSVVSDLPESLASRLSDEQRLALAEAPLGERLAILAPFLGLTDAEALASLAQSTGLTVASNLATDPATRGLLPARLAYEYQTIPIAFAADDGAPVEHTPTTPLHLATVWPPSDIVVDWVRTFTPRPLIWHLAVPERVHQLIVETFGVGSGSLEDSDDGYVAPEVAQQAEEVVDEDAAVVRFVSDVIAQAIDEEVGRGIVGRDPVKNNELAPEELEKAKADSTYKMKILRSRTDLPSVKVRAKGPKYTPVSKRTDKPDAIY